MRHTSKNNINAILEFNNCKTLEELNSKDSIKLNLMTLKGYVNLAEFTKSAIELHITLYDYELNQKLKFYEYREAIAEKAKTINNKIDLDASSAGEFSRWFFGNNSEHLAINSVKFRNENQVYRFPIGDGFQVSGEMRVILENAKREARKRNLEQIAKSSEFAAFSDDITNIQMRHTEIEHYEFTVSGIHAKIAELKQLADAYNKEIEAAKNEIKLSVTKIEDKNKTETNKVDIRDIYPAKFETTSLENNDSGDQAFSYKVLSEQGISNMRARNHEWFQKLKSKQK